MKHALSFVALALAAVLLFPACGDKAGGGGDSVEGTWELDVQSLKEAARASIEKEMEGQDESMKAMAKGMIDGMMAMFDKAQMTVEIDGDGTWSGKSKFPKEGPGKELKLEEVKGTWTLDGDKLTVITTHEDGKEKEEAETLVGTWSGDEIRLREDDGKMDFDLVMRRK